MKILDRGKTAALRLWNNIILYPVRLGIYIITKILITVGVIGGLIAVIVGIIAAINDEKGIAAESDYLVMRPISYDQDLVQTLNIKHALAPKNLSGTSLSGQSLSGANLSGSTLSGSTLSGSSISGVIASGTNLSGSTVPKKSASLYDVSRTGYMLVIDVDGMILGQKPEQMNFFDIVNYQGIVFGSQVASLIHQAKSNKGIVGLIIRIDSPGGTIFGSKMMSDAIADYKKQTKKPVYIFVKGMAASGGYRVAAAGTKIYADMGTSIGSIGVIMGPYTFYDQVISDGVVQAYGTDPNNPGGIQTTYITAGEGKDHGNPWRKMTQKEKNRDQSSVNTLYGVFVDHVSKERTITGSTIRKDIGAYVYDNIAATKNKLIDGTRSFDELLLTISADTRIAPHHLGVLLAPAETQSLVSSLQAMIPSKNAPYITTLCSQSSAMVTTYAAMGTICH